MEVGVLCPGFHCDLCMVDVPRAIFLAADALSRSLVYSANDYCQY